MKNQKSFEPVVFLLLVAAGVATRLYFRDIPNFAPVAAIALFSGCFFRSRWTALCVPLLVMALSDLVVGGYEAVLMVAVYGMLALPVVMRGAIRRLLDFESPSARRLAVSAAGLLGCSLVSSLLFFAVTNSVVWATSAIYEPTLAGLVSCYVQAIPFFRYTLAGDAFFAFALFGSYALFSLTTTANQPSRIADAV